MRACWVAIHGFESFALWVIFFFNDTATTEIYTLSLHDALPISLSSWPWDILASAILSTSLKDCDSDVRSEEHTSELQSQSNLVCRLLLEKKKKGDRADATPSQTAALLRARVSADVAA